MIWTGYGRPIDGKTPAGSEDAILDSRFGTRPMAHDTVS